LAEYLNSLFNKKQHTEAFRSSQHPAEEEEKYEVKLRVKVFENPYKRY